MASALRTEPTATRRSPSRLTRLAVAVALLATCENALAGNILRRGASGAPPRDRAAAQAAAQAGAASAREASGSVRRALDAIRRFQAAQDAARAAALAAEALVPNGLGPGGLQIADGVAVEGADLPTQAEGGGRTEVTVKQHQAKAVLTWETFNVGRETDLTFDQSAGGAGSRDWVALNRVVDPGARPSRILGSIEAEGQVYVVNRNGIVFGGASQVNTGAFLASTMDFAGPAVFAKGILGNPDGSIDLGRVAQQAPGEIEVQPGARIRVGDYGEVLLLGQVVRNGGGIEAPDGQVLLAAGDAIALDRGLARRSYAVPDASLTGAGKVENTGLVSTPRGNVTLVASDVVQGGMLTGTTGAEAEGSFLVGLDAAGARTDLVPGSITQILPDPGGKKVVGEGVFKPSQVTVRGADIRLLAGSEIYVPAGTASLGVSPRITTASPTAQIPDDVRVYLDAGSRIDVSGLRDVEVPMEQNTIRGELRAAELADNPILRRSALRGATVYYDVRRGVRKPTDASPGIASLEGYEGLVERDVAQLMTEGGTVQLGGNEIIVRPGSVIDLSGGSVRFRDGYTRSTILLDRTGRRVRIEDAVAGEAYQGIAGLWNVEHRRWGVTETFGSGLSRSRPLFEAGYVEGRAAGRLVVDTNDSTSAGLDSAPTPEASPTGAFRLLEGDVFADLVVGPRQREVHGTASERLAWSERPRGATLELKRSGDVEVADGPSLLPEGFGPGDHPDEALRYVHRIPARWLDGSVFGKVTVASGYTDDRVTGDAPGQRTRNFAPGGTLTVREGVTIDLGDGGEFVFAGKRADIDGMLLAPGGSVSIAVLDAPCCAGAEPTSPNRLRLGEKGVIDVAGRFTNEALAEGPRRALSGGTVVLEGLDVVLERGSRVDASGGARLEANGSKVTGGNGGRITIDVSKPLNPAGAAARDGTLALEGSLAAHGARSGGALALRTSYDVWIAEALPADAGSASMLLTPRFFTEGGFASYAIMGERSLSVAAGTVVAPSAEVLFAPGRPAEIPSGIRFSDIAERRLLPGISRAPMTLALSSQPDAARSDASMAVTVGEGAEILMEPGSTVALSSAGLLEVHGRIDAPAGGIALEATGSHSAQGLSPRIRIGSTGELLATGYAKRTVEGGLVRRSVEPGGTITLTVKNGVSGAGGPDGLQIDAGAVLDVSGTRGVADLVSDPGLEGGGGRYEERWVEGAAGRITLQASYGGSLLGTLRLAPGGETAAGGTLAITATGGQLLLGSGVTEDLDALAVNVDALNASGADDLRLAGTIRFDGDVVLEARRSLALSAAQLGTTLAAGGASVTLRSGRVLLEGGGVIVAPALGGASAPSRLDVEAELIDVTGTVLLGCPDGSCGWFEASFEAGGDVRLMARNAPNTNGASAGLLSQGRIAFEAAQVYVTSLERGRARVDADDGFLVASGAGIRVTGNGGAAPVPLSFGERLTLRAPAVVQGGVLRAPAGQIRLEGTGPDGSVTLLPGSVTSAALEDRTVLFGDVEGRGFAGYTSAGKAPAKFVTLRGADVDVQAGAIVDVSGGGDLMGYSFLEGNGGSRDVLADPNAFAILPGVVGGGFAPLDVAPELANANLKVGDQVTLRGVPGLADGTYTLLPARYALLDGGLLVQPVASSPRVLLASAPDTFVAADGSVVAAGRRGVAGTGIQDAGWSRFEVMDRNTFGAYSELATTSFDDHARALAADAHVTVRTPADAGTVVLDASRTLDLHGTGRFGAGAGRLLGNLDVSAQRIAVVAPGGAAPVGWLALEVDTLSGFGAGSVLLGGTRAAASGGTSLSVKALDVTVDTGGTAWTGPEILLAATGTVSLADGSEIRAEGPRSGDRNALFLAGDGALLRLSTGERVGIARSGTNGQTGVLGVGDARLATDGSLTLDGSASIDLSSGISLDVKQLDLAASRVLLGDAPEGEQGTRLGAALLASLAASQDLLVRGHESIRLWRRADGEVLAIGGRDASGARTLERLTLDTGLLAGEGGGVTARIDAGELTLRNAGQAAAPGTSGSGTLELEVDRLVLGPAANGVRSGGLQGTARIVEARGSGFLDAAGALTLRTARWTAGSGVTFAVTASGGASLTRGGLPAPGEVATSLGGRIELTAATIDLDTSVVLPAGVFQGAAGGSLRVGAGGSIDVRGAERGFGELTRYAPGGTIRLSAAGDLEIAAGATLDASGADRGGDSGRIELASGGSADLSGSLRAAAAPGWRGGAFVLDAAGVGSFTALNRGLEAGGFDDEREIRLRRQAIAIEAGERLRAHRVILRSDSAGVTVAGEIDASGGGARPQGGRVELVAAGDVAIAGTARIDARAGEVPDGGFEPSSGKVEVVSTGGRVAVAAGSAIDVSGGRQGGGEIVVRAPREGNDLAVDALAGELVGARRLVLQGSKRYDGVAAIGLEPGALDAQTLVSEASAWLAASADPIRNRLGLAGWEVAPAMLVTSAGGLAVGAAVDLDPLASPGYLGLQAAGDVVLGAGVALSDGFASAARDAALRDDPTRPFSFDYGLEAGGDVTLAPGAMIRTGTGDVSIRAGGGLRLESATSVVYTAGRKTAPAAGFTPPAGRPMGELPAEGGDIDIRAGVDIRATLPTQTTSAWLFRYGSGTQQTSWSVLHRNFEQGVGALGGGDVRIGAGRDVVQLDVAIPTTGHVTAPMEDLADAADEPVQDHAKVPSLALRGGGDLELRAGRDVRGGLFMLGRGHADVRAGGAVLAGETQVGLRNASFSTQLRSPQAVAVLFGLMDATASVTAASTVEVQAAFDPMRQGQIAENREGNAGSTFWGYTERTELGATSLAGDVRYRNDPWASVDPSLGGDPRYRVDMTGTGATIGSQLGRAPPTLRLASLEGRVPLANRVTDRIALSLEPSARGTLEVLAGSEVRIALNLALEDAAPEYRHGPLAPLLVTYQPNGSATVALEIPGPQNNFLRGLTVPVHAGDPEPARIYAASGSVCAFLNGTCERDPRGTGEAGQQALISMPKPLEVWAGADVVAGDYQPQNGGANDLSSIRAGRDLRDVAFGITGPGTAVLEAGRDVSFSVVKSLGVTSPFGGFVYAKGDSLTASTAARSPNTLLPSDDAADVYILAGAAAGVDYHGFAGAYLDPLNGQGVVRTWLPELGEFMRGLGYEALPEAELVAAFGALPETRRRVFLDQVLFGELKATGIDYNDPESPRYRSYERGYRAVSLLFPADPDGLPAGGAGSVLLNGKPVETQADGGITVLAPYGRVVVGNTGLNTSSADTGILTRRGGDVRIMAGESIDLETSRVFTLQGGDIVMWTSRGSITAGTGAKTGISQKPLSYLMSNDGVVTINAFGISTGAGIGVLDALQDAGSRGRSRMDLIAPEGEVNAGDAGIRVVGDLNIAAAVVVGMENIQVSGASGGVPAVEPPNTVALTTASAVAQAATKEGVGPAARPRQSVEDLPSILTVEVAGYETTDESGGEEEARKKRAGEKRQGGAR